MMIKNINPTSPEANAAAKVVIEIATSMAGRNPFFVRYRLKRLPNGNPLVEVEKPQYLGDNRWLKAA
jgi:hypothetical protein